MELSFTPFLLMQRAVISVVDDVLAKRGWEQSLGETVEKYIIPLPDITKNLCHVVLRGTASLFNSFYKFFPRSLMDSSPDDSERISDSSALVLHHSGFRAVDCRLGVGIYGGSHEAFFRDVQELLDNVCKSRVGGPYMVQLADTFSQLFHLAYEKEVLDVVRKLNTYLKSNSLSAEASREAKYILYYIEKSKIPRAPLNSGIRKVCSKDKDNECVFS